MPTPLVSVVIPTHNRRNSVKRLVQSVLNSSYKNVEIIVVDDASSDGTLAFLTEKYRKNKNITILHNKKNLYTAATRNKGAEKAKGDYIFFVDDDNVVDKNTIAELVKPFEDDHLIGEIGPINYNFNSKKKVLWCVTRRDMFTTKTYQPRSHKEFGKRLTWSTADVPNAFMVRREVFKKYKIKFREVFEIMYEESDYAYRVRNAGFKVVVARNARIYHDIEEARSKKKKKKDYLYHFMDNPRRPYLTARNRILFHSLYSTKMELFFIIVFWVWLFCFYYCYQMIMYSGFGSFSFRKRMHQVKQYLKGNIDGIVFLAKKNAIT